MSALNREACDASYDLPTAAQLRAAGINAIGRYITDPGPGNKGITQAEVDQYSLHDVAFFLIWELGANAVLKGYLQGVADAKRAQHNLEQLHGPSKTRPLYFAIDFDIQPAQYRYALDYFRGVVSVIGLRRTGAYGHAAILDYLVKSRLISFRFQTYAWSKGVEDASNDVLQYRNGQPLGSGTVDLCKVRGTSNWGQKGVILAKPKPATAPGPAKPDPHVLYTVKDGDTLSGIAASHRTSLQQIEKLNQEQITDPNRISVGQKVRVK